MATVRRRFTVEGMHCGSCAVSTGMILRNVRGVKAARAEFESLSAEIEYDDAETGLAEMNKALEGLGYRLKEVT